MSEPLLNVMKIMLLAGLYLFFVRVLWSVYNELRDPRAIAGAASPDSARPASARPAPRLAAPDLVGAGQRSIPTTPSGSRSATALAPVVGQLVVVEPMSAAGLTWALGNEITLGRAATCGVHLDNDTYVSSVHARIFNRGGTFMFEDLASRNGSMINGVGVTEAVALAPGDRIQIGGTLVEFS